VALTLSMLSGRSSPCPFSETLPGPQRLSQQAKSTSGSYPTNRVTMFDWFQLGGLEVLWSAGLTIASAQWS
jgi:hypothetical protein